MPKKTKFSAEDEEKIINFVRLNENMRNKRFRDIEARNRLWLQLANELAMDVEVVKKKWQTMRDYFVRKTTESVTSPLSRRDKLLSFLLQTSVSNGSSLSSVEGPSIQLDTQSQVDSVDSNSNAYELPCTADSESAVSSPHTPKSMKRRVAGMDVSKMKKILREFSAHRPKPSDFKPEIPSDDIQQFFDSIASTVRKFSPTSIAKIKIKISKIVGEEEIAWAKKAFRLECRRAQALLRQSTSRHKQDSDNSIANFFNYNYAEHINSTSTPTTPTEVNDIVYHEVKAQEDAATVEPFESVKIKTEFDISPIYNIKHKESSKKTDHRKNERSRAKRKRIKTQLDISLPNNEKMPKYICEICGQTFTVLCYFQMHINRHKGEQTFACEICPEKYYTQQSLKRHMLKHTGAQPNACRYCPRRFLDYSGKMRHERMHTNDRPCKCPYCGKAFTSNYILKNHVLTHTGERSFSCEICQRSFVQRKHLMSHIKTLTHKQNEANMAY